LTRLESSIMQYRQHLPTIGRILIVLTFLEDSWRIAIGWNMQVSFLCHPENHFQFPTFLAHIFLMFTLLSQLVGGTLVVVNKQIKFACTTLLVFMGFLMLVYGFALPDYVHHNGRLRFLFRSLSIIGGLLMLIADARIREEREKISFDFGVDPLSMAKYIQLGGRIALALQCIQFYTHGYIFGILCTVAALAVVFGFHTKYASLGMALLLTVSNLAAHNFWDMYDDDYDATIYFLFQDLSVLGGFILLVSLGPGGVSYDGRKSL